jgi:hypothetical protein
MKTPSWYNKFILDDNKYTIVGVQGIGFIEPKIFGLTPIASVSTDSWWCTFCLRNNSLILDEMVAFHGYIEDGKIFFQIGPEINGVKPFINKFDNSRFAFIPPQNSPNHPNGYFSNIYQGLNLEVSFSGGILIGDKFIYGLYSGMLYSRILEYKKVIELILKQGKVIEIRDVSPQVQELRDNGGIISDFVPY